VTRRAAFARRDASRGRRVGRRADDVVIESPKVRDGNGDGVANRRRREQERDDTARRFGVPDRRLGRREPQDALFTVVVLRATLERAHLDGIAERRPRAV